MENDTKQFKLAFSIKTIETLLNGLWECAPKGYIAEFWIMVLRSMPKSYANQGIVSLLYFLVKKAFPEKADIKQDLINKKISHNVSIMIEILPWVRDALLSEGVLPIHEIEDYSTTKDYCVELLYKAATDLNSSETDSYLLVFLVDLLTNLTNIIDNNYCPPDCNHCEWSDYKTMFCKNGEKFFSKESKNPHCPKYQLGCEYGGSICDVHKFLLEYINSVPDDYTED